MSEQATRAIGIGEILETVLERSRKGEFDGVPVHYILGNVCVAPSIVALDKLAMQNRAGCRLLGSKNGECCGIQWLYVAVATWAISLQTQLQKLPGTSYDPDMEELYEQDYAFYALAERFPSLKTNQEWELRKRNNGGSDLRDPLSEADLFLRGGFNGTEDDSLTLHLVQSISFTDFPWGDSDSFALRVRAFDERKMLVIYLPGED